MYYRIKTFLSTNCFKTSNPISISKNDSKHVKPNIEILNGLYTNNTAEEWCLTST